MTKVITTNFLISPYPAINSKATIGKIPGRTINGQDLMPVAAVEKNNTIIGRFD